MGVWPFLKRRKFAEGMGQAQAEVVMTQQLPELPEDIWRIVSNNLVQPRDRASFRQACKEFRAIIRDFPEEFPREWGWLDPRAAHKSPSLMAACLKAFASLHPCEAFQLCRYGSGLRQGRTFETAAWDDEMYDDDFGF